MCPNAINTQDPAVQAEATTVAEERGVASRTWWLLAGLIALNHLNYIDRHLLPGALPVLSRSLQVSDVEIGALFSWFFFAYMWGGPLLSWLGDRMPPASLALLCGFAWSASLGLATLAQSSQWFGCAYALSGLAMSGFGIFGVAMLSDVAPVALRSRALSWFFLAMTAGRAVGVPTGGWLAQSFGWRAPFQVCALAGILLVALLAFIFPVSARCGTRNHKTGEPRAPILPALRSLGAPSYLFPVLGLATHTFALGGLNVWLPMLLCRRAGYSPASASVLMGSATLIGGLTGTWIGGLLGDRLHQHSPRALCWVPATALFLAAPCVGAVLLKGHVQMICGIVGLQFFLGCALGPLNAALLNGLPAAIRATSLGLAIMIIHALGDVPSPRLIGLISDRLGLPAGISITIVALIIGGLILSSRRSYSQPAIS